MYTTPTFVTEIFFPIAKRCWVSSRLGDGYKVTHASSHVCGIITDFEFILSDVTKSFKMPDEISYSLVSPRE